MKNFFGFIFFAALTVCLVYVLDTRIEPVPPLGKFLNPFGGFWQNAENEHSNFSKILQIEGLKAKVTVQYDLRMVPHIFAENEADLFAAQGYVTAQHRLWQMEIQTLAAAGRLSEIFGKDLLENDRYQRRIGMVYGAEKSLDSMLKNHETKLMLENYARGINAYISSLKPETLPLEYKLLDYKPEKWTTLKSALLLKSMSYNLSGSEKDFEYTNFLHLFGREMIELLFPDFPDGQEPIVDKMFGKKLTEADKLQDKSKNKLADKQANNTKNNKQNKVAVADMLNGGGWNFEPLQVQKPKESYVPELYLPKSAFSPNPDNGSNNWVVSGKKTVSGYPILCNDPHLQLSLPSIWYEIQLNCPTINVYGVSLPGTPTVIIGFNDSISWGVTNAKRDVMDWYKIKFKDENKNEYFYNNSWKASTKKVENYKIRNKFQLNFKANLQENLHREFFTDFKDTVVYTHHGMVSYDQNYNKNEEHKQGFALRWAAHEGGNELQSFYLLNKAQNYHDFKNALENYACPAQNFVFASVQNDIAVQVQGKFPVKWFEQGKFILDGSEPLHEWQKYIPYEHQVREKNPARGFVSSANQHPVDKSYPYYTFDHHFEHYRNRRINNILDTAKNITAKSMMAMQNDNFNLMAAENLPFLLSQLDLNIINQDEKKAYEELVRWTYYNDAKLLAPVYFEEWISSLMKMVYQDEFDTAKIPMPTPEKYVVLQLLKNQTPLAFWDNKKTVLRETSQMLIRLSFAESAQKTQEWRKNIMNKEDKFPYWANYKQSSVQHLTKIAPFSEFYIQNGGNKSIINANFGQHGASWRMVIELNPQGVKAYGVYPGGQSGNVGSKYYTNQLKTWEKGEYFDLQFWKDKKAGGKEILFVQESK